MYTNVINLSLSINIHKGHISMVSLCYANIKVIHKIIITILRVIAN